MMRDTLVLIAALFFLLATFTSRFAGALAYWWFSIFRPQEWVWGDISSLRLSLVVTVLFIIPCIFQGLIPSFRNAISTLMLLFLGFIGLAAFLTQCQQIGFRADYLLDFSISLTAVFFTIKVVDSANKMFVLLAMIAAIISFHAGKAGLQSLLGIGGTFYGSSEMGGMFSGSNAFALGSAILLFFVLNTLMIISNKKSRRVFVLPSRFPRLTKLSKIIVPILIVGIIYNVIALSSRGSALAMIIGLVLWMWLSSLIRVKTIILSSILVVGLISFVDLPDGYTERLASAFAGKEELDESAASRPYFWNIALQIVSDHPLGVGPGCYNSFYNFYDETRGHYGFFRTVHSSHFEVLAEGGYLATFVWLLLFIISIIKCFGIRKRAKKKGLDKSLNFFSYHTSNMAICSILVYILGGAFYALAYNPLIWLLFGIVVILDNIQKKAGPTAL
jgi:O-antigen ligase